MNRVEMVPHLRVAFRQLGEDGRKGLTTELRDIAIDLLQQLVPRITRPLSPTLRHRYRVQGIDIGWDLRRTEDAFEFCALVGRDGTISLLERKASELLRVCSHALESESINEKLIESILDAYGACDIPAIKTGRLFTAGRRAKPAGPVRKKIAALLGKRPDMTNPELWEVVTRTPPRGWEFVPDKQGGRLEGRKADQHMSKRRFQNVCSEERKKRKV